MVIMNDVPVYAYTEIDYYGGGRQTTAYTFADAEPPNTVGVAGIQVSRYEHRLAGRFSPAAGVTAKVKESNGDDLLLFLAGADGGETGYTAFEVVQGAPEYDGLGEYISGLA